MDLVLQESTIGSHRVISVCGEIDLATIPRLHTGLARVIGALAGTTIVVDLDEVVACDDAGLGSLLGSAGRAREAGGDLVIVCSEGPLRARLERTGFDRAVRVVSSVAALDSTSPGD